MQFLGHRDAYVGVEDVRGEAVAVQDEIAGDGAVGDADDGAGFAGDVEGGFGLAEGGVRQVGVFVEPEEVGAAQLQSAAGDGRAGGERIEVWGVGPGGVQQSHVYSLAQVRDEVREGEADEQRKETRGDVVEHDAGAFGQGFELADGPGFEDVEEAEE